MADGTATAMDALEIATFLAGQVTGVLAMAAGERVYAVPVSFAYADDGPALYFRLGYGPESQKRSFVEASDEATFVVHDRSDGRWTSVIAEGRLESLSESALDSSVVQSVEQLSIPFFQVHQRPAAELEFAIVRLDIDKLSGVAEPRRARQGD